MLRIVKSQPFVRD